MYLMMPWQYFLSFTAITPIILYGYSVLEASDKYSAFNTEINQDLITNKTLTNNSSYQGKQQKRDSLFQQLNLTSEQEVKIRQLHQEYTQAIRRKENTLATVEQKLSDMLIGTESIESIKIQNQQLMTLRQDIETLRFECMLATREILTPQQRQKFQQLVKLQLDN